MNNLEKIYEYIDKYSKDSTIDTQEKWNNLFILICNMIDDLGSYKKEHIEHIIKMIDEYDFERNRGNNENN